MRGVLWSREPEGVDRRVLKMPSCTTVLHNCLARLSCMTQRGRQVRRLKGGGRRAGGSDEGGGGAGGGRRRRVEDEEEEGAPCERHGERHSEAEQIAFGQLNRLAVRLN